MSTELFKVTCVTCQSSLSVRNPALIDQIVACPKCDSMVHVVPPAATVPTGIAPIVSAAPAIEPTVFEEPVEAFVEPGAPTTVETAPADVASVLDVANTSNASFIMWAAGSFIVGVTLMGALLLLRGGNDSTQAVPAENPVSNAIVATEPTVESTPAAQVLPVVTGPDVASTEPPATPPKQESRRVVPQAEPSLLGPVEAPVDEPIAEAQTINDKPLVTPQQNEPAEKLVIQPAEEPHLARKFDPLAMDPEELNLADMSEANSNADQPQAEASEPEVEPIDDRHMNAVVPVRLDDESGHGSANRIASIQLRRELPAVVVKEMPLLNFLTFMGDLAGVPVSIEPEQLLMAGYTPGRPVSVDVSETTLSEVLDGVLKPLHLVAISEGPQVVIVRQDADKVRSVDYPVDDLLGGQLTAADVGKWIESLIAPDSWESAGGDGTMTASSGSLKVSQTQAIQYQVLFFLERVRLAKGLPMRSKYPARLLSGKPFKVGIADRLDAPATFTFSHNTPLAEVFHYWQGEAGLPIFVDWPALARVGLWPDSRITCTSANEPWRTAFDKILGPLDLAWRAAPGGAIQITSKARTETEPGVDIYPAGAWRGDATDAAVIDDPVNGLTYVRAPAVAHTSSSP